MPSASRKFLLGLGLLFVAGGLIGWFYDRLIVGLLVASLLALIWQVRHLLAFVNALQTRDFSYFRDGDGVWQQMFAQFNHERERASKHKASHRRLLKEVRRSTDAMPDGAVILDMNNDIIMCNKAAKTIAGLKPKKDRGQRVDNILRDPKLAKLLQANDFKREVEIPSPVEDGGWLNCRVVPYGAEQKLLVLRDVTERIRLSRMRRDFVANASHELRSPLTVIAGYLDSLAEDSQLPEEWSHPIAQMQSQARRMNRILAELLELSRIESSGPAAQDELVDVVAQLSAARKAYHQPGVSARIVLDVRSTVQLRGNTGEIESVITNLVSNAVRHTPVDGRIALHWSDDESGATLSVSDTGEGIAAHHIPRLTERFFRVDRGRARHDGGVGLGLAIVKHVLGRHDATLEIKSKPDEGSTFICKFSPQRIAPADPVPMVSERTAI